MGSTMAGASTRPLSPNPYARHLRRTHMSHKPSFVPNRPSKFTGVTKRREWDTEAFVGTPRDPTPKSQRRQQACTSHHRAKSLSRDSPVFRFSRLTITVALVS